MISAIIIITKFCLEFKGIDSVKLVAADKVYRAMLISTKKKSNKFCLPQAQNSMAMTRG